MSRRFLHTGFIFHICISFRKTPNTCVSYSVKQTSKREFNEHIAKQKRAKAEKQFDKKAAKFSGRHTFASDFYKQRLQSHNFSMYNLSSHQCTAYWWDETEGDLSASSFVSCVIHHLEVHCLADTFPITLYSDGCGYQNRNQFLSNALSNFAVKHNKIIEQKFLEKGHTQMEVDSIHAKIEKIVKRKPIYVPYDLVNVTKEARQTVKINGVSEPKPIDVEYLTFPFFKNYADERVLRFNSIRPGNKAHDPTVNQLRSLIYLPSGAIKFKIDFDDEYKDLPRLIKPFDESLQPKALHTSRIKITEGKFNHLQSLKSVIPVKYHDFYNNLPFTKISKPNENNKRNDQLQNAVSVKLTKAKKPQNKTNKNVKSVNHKSNKKLNKITGKKLKINAVKFN